MTLCIENQHETVNDAGSTVIENYCIENQHETVNDTGSTAGVFDNFGDLTLDDVPIELAHDPCDLPTATPSSMCSLMNTEAVALSGRSRACILNC